MDRRIPHGAYTCGNLLCDNNGWHLSAQGVTVCDRREREIRGTEAEIALARTVASTEGRQR